MLLSEALDRLSIKARCLAHKRYWLTIFVILIIIVLINGVDQFPSHAYFRLSQNPFITRTDIDEGNYWQENILLPVVAYTIQATSKANFYLFCAALLIGVYVLFAAYSRKNFDLFPALLFSILFITSPLTTILLSWVGTPDGFTVGLTISFLFSTSYGLFFILGLFGATNYIAFSIAVGEVMILRRLARTEKY